MNFYGWFPETFVPVLFWMLDAIGNFEYTLGSTNSYSWLERSGPLIFRCIYFLFEHGGIPATASVDGSEIRRSPVEGKVVEIPLFFEGFDTSNGPVVGLGISEPSTAMLHPQGRENRPVDFKQGKFAAKNQGLEGQISPFEKLRKTKPLIESACQKPTKKSRDFFLDTVSTNWHGVSMF